MKNQEDQGYKLIETMSWLLKRDELSIKQKNQIVFLMGRVEKKKCKERAIKILSDIFDQWDWKSRMTTQEAMYIRSVGISLIYLGAVVYENVFYNHLIYNGFLSKINRNFHIHYFLTESYYFNTDLLLDDESVCSVENIDGLYDYLYHSIFSDKSRKESIGMSIITILNLSAYNIFYLEQKEKVDRVLRMIKRLRDENIVTRQIILKYIDDVELLLESGNVYAATICDVYGLKTTKRIGWIKREINKRTQTESVADHTWACCQLAMLFLPENADDCKFLDSEEFAAMGKYDLHRIMEMLIVHDLSEAYTGDIVTSEKTEKNIENEKNVIKRLVTLDTLPHFNTFGFVEELYDEFEKQGTYNAKIARDIDLIEPLCQLYIYRKFLKSYAEDKGYSERDEWIKDVKGKLNTKIGRNLLHFLQSHVFIEF